MTIEAAGVVVGLVAIFWGVWTYYTAALPPRTEVTYRVLRTLATSGHRGTESLGLDYGDLEVLVIKECNDNSTGLNFNPRRSRRMKGYIADSIDELSRPKSKGLEPLAERVDDRCRITDEGRTFHDSIVDEPFGVRVQSLEDLFKGVNRSSITAPESQSTRGQSVTPREIAPKHQLRDIRIAVFEAVPESGGISREELLQKAKEDLGWVKFSKKKQNPQRIERAIDRLIRDERLSEGPDGLTRRGD